MHPTFNVKMTSHEQLEMKANIKFCSDLGKTPTKILKSLQKTRGNNMSVSRAIVLKWHRRLKDGRQNVENDEQQGREAVIYASSATSIETALEGDRRLIIRELSEVTDVSCGNFIVSWLMY